MRRTLQCCVLGLLAAGCALGALDGTVINKTTGKPQAGVPVTLVKPGQGGMRTLGNTTSDSSGHFAFEHDEPGGGPQLLQAAYAGVNYNKLMTPNLPMSNIELDVFESSKSPALTQIAQRMMLFEPNASQIGVSETVVVQNPSNTTFNNPELGGLQFYLPPAANGQVRVRAQGPQGMPLPKAAEKIAQSDIYKVDFAIKPGETQFEVDYVLPAGSPFTFRGMVTSIKGMIAGPMRLIAPPGVTLSGKDIQPLGVEPNTQASVYNVNAPGPFSVDIVGTGSLRGNNDDNAGAGPDNGDAPQVVEANPPMYAHLGWMVGLAFSVLVVGLLLLFRSSPVESPRV